VVNVGYFALEHGRGVLLLEKGGYLELETPILYHFVLERNNGFLLLNNGAFFELEAGP
jgi:hypothetical protein